MVDSKQPKWKRFVVGWRCPCGQLFQDLGLESLPDAIAAAEHALQLSEEVKQNASERRRLAQELRRVNAPMTKDLELIAPPFVNENTTAAETVAIWHDWHQRIYEEQRGEAHEVEKWSKRVRRLRRMLPP